MKIATVIVLVAASLSFLGCAGGPPSAEQQDRQQSEEAAATRRAETFARSLPPAR
jgi:hypothetical protein